MGTEFVQVDVRPARELAPVPRRLFLRMRALLVAFAVMAIATLALAPAAHAAGGVTPAPGTVQDYEALIDYADFGTMVFNEYAQMFGVAIGLMLVVTIAWKLWGKLRRV